MSDLYTIVKNIVDRGVNAYIKTINKDENLINEILDYTSYLPSTAKMNERVYCIINPNNVPTKCQNGKFPLFNTLSKGYRKFCGTGKDCVCKQQSQSEKLKNICKNNPDMVLQREEKRKQTCIEKYGEDHPMKTVEGMNNYYKKYEERTGYKTSFHDPNTVDKAKKSTLEKYGVERPLQNGEFRKQCTDKAMSLDPTMAIPRNAYHDKTGYSNPSLNPVDRQKQLDGMMNNHGVHYPLQSNSVKEKMIEKEREGYNRNHYMQRYISDDVWEIFNDKNKVQELVDTKSMAEIAEIFHYKNIKSVYGKIKEIGIILPRSSYEIVIAKFLEENNISFTQNDRTQIKPKELDFFLPDYKLAIEFNGLYWHSDIFKENNYHLNKYLACKEKSIRLISINEDEFIKNEKLVFSKIINLIGKSEKGLPARKLKIMEISFTDANNFCEKYHIQGKTGTSEYSLGAYDETNNLVGVMIFNKQRITNCIELIRFCHDGKIHNGLFSKFMSFVEKNTNYDEIISFADLRYSDGNLYEKNGFKKERIIKPEYRYIVNNKTFHKSNFTKSKIMKKFNLTEDYIKSKTEKELMEEYNISKIYDIGKIKYIWNR